MNRFVYGFLIWIAAGSVAVGAAGASRYPVSELLKVRSLSEFDCKIRGYADVSSVRFRVQVRDVDPATDIPSREAAEYVRERFRQAEQLVLENVTFRNYFRLTADVRVDGADLREELVRLGLAEGEEPNAVSRRTDETAGPDPETPPPKRRYQPPSAEPSSQPATAAAVKAAGPGRKVVFITLQELLETEADLSSLNETTPLGEALHVISESVRPRVPFVILWNDLQTNALVDKETPIGVGGFDRQVKLSYALKIILHTVSRNAPTKLTLAYEGRVVTLGTRRGLLQKARVKSYSIEDIVSAPAADTTDNQRMR